MKKLLLSLSIIAGLGLAGLGLADNNFADNSFVMKGHGEPRNMGIGGSDGKGDFSAGLNSLRFTKEFPHIKENNIQYLGQIAHSYLLLKYEESLWILDQYAAHELVLYTKKQKERAKAKAERLMNSLILEVSEQEQMMLEQKSEMLKSFGYVFKKDVNQVIIDAIPSAITVKEARELFTATLKGKKLSLLSLEELWLLHASKFAVRAGTTLSKQEALSLIDAWLQIEENREFCPHGRPIVLQFGAVELEKLFKRK